MGASTHTKNFTTATGIVLVGIGLIMLAATTSIISFNWAAAWPLFLMIAGVLLLVPALHAKHKVNRVVMVAPGLTLLLLGSFFLTITVGPLAWSSLELLWPMFTFIFGAVITAAYLLNGKKSGYGLLTGALISLTSVALLLFLTFDGTSTAMARAWPIFVIAAGAGLLAGTKMKKR